ncbi:hypothetical protein [Streptomyces sp. x-80]
MKVKEGQRVAEVKPVCKKCQEDFPHPSQFEPNIEPEKGGIWLSMWK